MKTSKATEINSLDQYSHHNNLIIYAVLEGNIHHALRRLVSAIQFRNIVDTVQRMGKRNNTDLRPIIIKFVSRQDRDEFLRKRRVRRHLKVTDLGYSDNSVYINQSLTSDTRDLFKLTKTRAKDRNFTQVWVSNCSIFVHTDKGNSSVIRILSVEILLDEM